MIAANIEPPEFIMVSIKSLTDTLNMSRNLLDKKLKQFHLYFFSDSNISNSAVT